mgnify:CR=1 FL=1
MKSAFTIAKKLPLALFVSALLVGAGVGTASYLVGSSALVRAKRVWSAQSVGAAAC